MSDNQEYIERGKRLKKFREDFLCIKTASEFADLTGVPQSNYSRVEAGGRDIPNKILEFISKRHSEINLGWLLFGIDSMTNSNLNSKDLVSIDENEPNVRFLNVVAHAGIAVGINEPEQSTWIHIPGLTKKENQYGLLVEGNSMIPTLLKGDFVICELIINAHEEFRHGEIYVIVLHDRILVKRIFIVEGRFQLYSDNPIFKPEFAAVEDIIKLYIVTFRVTKLSII
jgi:SOS-response transcriptional repressor LexA